MVFPFFVSLFWPAEFYRQNRMVWYVDVASWFGCFCVCVWCVCFACVCMFARSLSFACSISVPLTHTPYTVGLVSSGSKPKPRAIHSLWPRSFSMVVVSSTFVNIHRVCVVCVACSHFSRIYSPKFSSLAFSLCYVLELSLKSLYPSLATEVNFRKTNHFKQTVFRKHHQEPTTDNNKHHQQQ